MLPYFDKNTTKLDKIHFEFVVNFHPKYAS